MCKFESDCADITPGSDEHCMTNPFSCRSYVKKRESVRMNRNLQPTLRHKQARLLGEKLGMNAEQTHDYLATLEAH